MVVHCAPRFFRTSVNAVAVGRLSVVLISSQLPASAYSTSGNVRGCHSMVSSLSASIRRLLPFSSAPVPNCKPSTASMIVPCSSSTSMSASTPDSVDFGHPGEAVVGIAGGGIGAESTDTQRKQQTPSPNACTSG